MNMIYTFQGKKILLIATAFFGYELAMKKAMENLGAEVVFYDERSIKAQFGKALLKISPSLFKKRTEEYYKNIVRENEHINFDDVYIYGATMIDHSIVGLLKEKIRAKRMILYLADSVQGNERYEKMFPFFDKISTFDRGDYNYYKDKFPQLTFLPLFYSDEYNEKDMSFEHSEKYDIVFVGTVHSDRLLFLDMIKEQADLLGLKTYFYCYLQGRFMFFFRFLTQKAFRKKKMSDFQYNKLSASGVREIMAKSSCILDAQYPKNMGLTMRTFETLGMNRKLITTNADIRNYDFYHPSNVLVVDRKHPKLSKEFFDTPYEMVESEIREKYSINQWLVNLFS